MEKKYFVKTRNWHCNRKVKKLLDISLKFGAYRGDSYTDGDGKYCLDTDSALKAWAVWLYYMILRRWTGGMTYIVRPKKEFTINPYKSIY